MEENMGRRGADDFVPRSNRVLGHMGMSGESTPWTYADVISHTNGIDVFLDGHSHDMEQVVMKNKDGENVTRSACGTIGSEYADPYGQGRIVIKE